MEKQKIQKLLFIYNANTGAKNAILDSAHKFFSPSTYQCSLCDITFGVFTENKTWKNFRLKTNVQMEFLHKDEFTKMYSSKFGAKFSFPIVLAETNDLHEIFINTEELNSFKDVEALIKTVKNRV